MTDRPPAGPGPGDGKALKFKGGGKAILPSLTILWGRAREPAPGPSLKTPVLLALGNLHRQILGPPLALD